MLRSILLDGNSVAVIGRDGVIEIITHEKTREMMMGPALAFNKSGVETELPAYVKSLEQKTNVRHTFPTRTFNDWLDLDLGGRQVQVLHHERAVTPGDAFLYLPKEKILITGDLLVNPIAFALSVFPTGWLRTLERLDGPLTDDIARIPQHKPAGD